MSYVTYSMFDTEDPGQQPAAEIEPMKGSSNETTWLYNGYVTEQTFEQLAGIVEETPGMKKLNFSSWGGTLSGAQKITDLLLDNGIEFTVADLGVCASACVYILTHTDPAPDAYGIYVLYTGHFSIIIT